jgi:hypothetical protein
LIHKGVQRVTKDHTVSQSYTKPYPTIPLPNHTLYSREDPRPLVTASSTIMVVVYSTEVSTLYPRVVISSLAEQLENLLFAILYTSFFCMAQRSLHAVTKVYYRGMSCFATVPEQTVPACSAKVSCTNVPSYTMWFWQVTKYVTKYDHKVWCHPHSIEHDTQPIAYLISKQAFHTRHVVAHIVLGCLLLRFGP